MSDLLHKKCVPCEGGVPPLTLEQAHEFLKQAPGWELLSSEVPFRITKTWKFKNFKAVMAFLNSVAALAEEQGHHPDIEAHYSSLKLMFFTHAIGGLSENDFIMAAKVNALS